MQETNGNPQNQMPKQEICTIRITFPVESDEQAIGYKTKIGKLIADIPDSSMQFAMMTMPDRSKPHVPMV